MAVGTRRLTVRSVDSLTVRTLMTVVPTTAASRMQSTLKPRINRPRIFNCAKINVNSLLASSRQALSEAGLSINHKDSNNPRPVLVRIFSATMHHHVRIGSEPDRRAVRIFDGWFRQPRYQINGFDWANRFGPKRLLKFP